MPELNYKQYTKLLDGLPGNGASAPPAGSLQGPPQLNDGTSWVTGPSGTVAHAFVETLAGVPDEQWVLFQEASWQSGPLSARQVSDTVKRLDTPTLTTLQDRVKAGETILYTSFQARYYGMPSAASIAGLPDTNPVAVTSVAQYELYSNPGGNPGPRSGFLFRERVLTASKKIEHHDHWVFHENFFSPAGNDTLGIVRSAAGPATLKAFLTAQRQLFDTRTAEAQNSWRYGPTTYIWGPLPAKVG